MAFCMFKMLARGLIMKNDKNLAKLAGVKVNFLCSSSIYLSNSQTRFFATRKYSKLPKTKQEDWYESDSDVEISKDTADSQFWRRKMRTFHGILDVNKDGVIAFDDFKLLADRFVDLGHLSELRAEEFRSLLKRIWEKQWGEVTPYNLVTVEQYLEDMTHVINDKDRAKTVHYFLPFLFEALDADKSGEITEEEFILFFECLGLNLNDAVFTFRTIDTDSDGLITMREFIKHGKEFFLSDDENRISKYFWGPLAEN